VLRSCLLFAIVLVIAPSRSSAQPGVTIQDCAGTTASFTFQNDNIPGQAPYPRLSDSASHSFVEAFCREAVKVKKWYVDRGWGPPPVLPALQIDVDDKYQTSASLVHMALGQSGRIDFPASEVEVGKTGIAHELTHIVLPNGNRFLAEGLAVYVQQEIGSNQAVPNFGRPLYSVVRELSCGMHLIGAPTPRLDEVQFDDADRVATPSPVAVRVGLVPFPLPPAYTIAGSFVQYLIESRGMERFRNLYSLTPLMPGKRNEGSPDRWAHVYGVTIGELARGWHSRVVRLHCPR
jgi:hypothetical protein